MKAKSRCVCLIWSHNSIIMGPFVHDSSYFSLVLILCVSESIKNSFGSSRCLNSWNTWFIEMSCVFISCSNFWRECIARERDKFNDHKTIFKQRQCYVYDCENLLLLYLTGTSTTLFKHGTPVEVFLFCLIELRITKYFERQKTIADESSQTCPEAQIEKRINKNIEFSYAISITALISFLSHSYDLLLTHNCSV